MKRVFARLGASVAGVFRGTGRMIWRHPWLFLAAVPVLLSVAAALYVKELVPLTPSVANIQKAKFEYPSVLLTADGQELAVFKHVNRAWVKLADVSPHVVDALIATEDRKFFEHRGLDLQRTAAAALSTVRGDVQGGSTITQQLARNLYPDEIGRAPTVARKLKEAITALKIEAAYSKQDILETYLNTVPFLYNAHGIEVAARTYFDKPASQLNVLESATLIGMLKGTSYYNPVLNPERAVQRRNTVLAQMVRYQKLDPAQFELLKNKPLGLDFERQTEDLGPAPHLTQQLRRWLISWADRKGYDIYADGLVVRTTIDSKLQSLATQALTRQADKLQAIADKTWGNRARANQHLVQEFVRETHAYRSARESGLSDELALKKMQRDAGFMQKLWREKTTLQAAFLAMEPGTGQVKAWVGSRDFKQDQFDHVQQARRQPGSTFKPFVYGAAFEQGISPWETFIDEAVEIPLTDGTVWKPGDVHATSGLPTTLRDGLIHSMNTITAQLVQRIGAGRVAQVAYAMGVRQSKLDPVPSLALGTSPVSLKEMVSAYGTIVNSGSYVEPALVVSVQNRAGRVLEQFHPAPPEQALSRAAAQTLLDIMRGVIDKGTGAAIRSRYGIKGDLAGKTGTTQDNTDGWFILMHPNLVGGAWVGFNDNRITMGDSWGQGAHNALNIVGDFFQQTLKSRAIDAKARFAAPHDAGADNPLVQRMNDWLGSVDPTIPDSQAALQAAAISEPPPWSAPALLPEPPAVPAVPEQPGQLVIRVPEVPAADERRALIELGAAAAQPRPEPWLDRRPELQPQPWLEPRPDLRREMAPEPAPALRPQRPAEGGIRILREVLPASRTPESATGQQ